MIVRWTGRATAAMAASSADYYELASRLGSKLAGLADDGAD